MITSTVDHTKVDLGVFAVHKISKIETIGAYIGSFVRTDILEQML